ncbi:MAG TPA: DUF1553 domain-containing protein [Bryobacteraceae bacterium]|nr:DUF1553 domain-containing protein [Bryobacteraceae bacterium]
MNSPGMAAVVVLLGTALAPSVRPAASPDHVEFNRDIRPILSDKCYTCHGPDTTNRKTKLRFDIENGARIDLAGGRKVIVAKHPEQSEIFRRISSDNQAIRMPPAYLGRDRLSDHEIELIRRWIEQGAVWERHWSLSPPKRPPLPGVRDARWPRNPIDYAVLARLEREGLHPSPEADRRTLIRRASLDLTGLPPTPAEVDAFLNDASANAYEKVVDRLLASSRYGERMAFRWMEAARYADTNGYQSDGVRDMWRWRDWVVDAFNRNMPYDEFTVDQLAGDLLAHPTLDQRIATAFNRNHRTSAEGGIVPEEFRVEYVADRVETTSAVWLGLTVGCARCHDHKYDPISQRDYYRLFSYFNNVPEKGFVYNFGNEEPYIAAPTPPEQKRLEELDANVVKLERQNDLLRPKLEKAQRRWERTVARSKHTADWTVTEGLAFRQDSGAEEKTGGCDVEKSSPCEVALDRSPFGQARRFDGQHYLESTKEVANFDYTDPFTFSAWIMPDSPKGAILSHADDFFEGQGHGLYLIDGKIRLHVIYRWTDLGMRVETEEPVKLHQWQHVLVTYDGKRKASGVRIYLDGHPQKLKILFDQIVWPMKGKRPFRIGAGGGLRFKGEIADVRVYNIALSAEQAAVIPVRETIRQIAAVPPGSRGRPQEDKLRFCFLETGAPQEIRRPLEQLRAARQERGRYYATIPTVMVMEDSKTPRDTFVLRRGAYDNPGEKVTPGVPSILPPLDPAWPNNRLGLARWLVDRSNPLTARVTVNRFWQMYFGTGLVKTVQDFGSQGEPPSNPELLDWLAVEFMDSGWNVKALQKTIVMSATYRQSSKITPQAEQTDPENRLLARGPRLRLGPEMIRDQALYLAGLLVEKLGGPPVKPYQPAGLWQELAGGKGYVTDKGENLYRRSLYTYWKRTVAPPFMVNFDSPNRETCTVNETRTNTPLQALNLMNDETFLEAARKLAERAMREGGGDDPRTRLDYIYRLALARPPRPSELQVLVEALERFETRYRTDAQAAQEFLSYGDSARDPALDPSQLAAYGAVASLVLNLDETITKE